MQKRKFFKAEEIDACNKWVMDSHNSTISAMKLEKLKLSKGDTREFIMRSSEAIIVTVSGKLAFELCGERDFAKRFDVIYVTNGGECTIVALCPSEVLVCEAHAETSFRSAFIRRKDVLPVESGEGSFTRQVWNMVSPGGIEAERLILGYCESTVDGGWTGWPPHEHGGNLEEVYYYYDISGPVPGVLQVLSKDMRGEMAVELAKSGDVFAISGGFHPVVAFPGTKMKNLWFMAALRPEDRDFGLVKVDTALLKG